MEDMQELRREILLHANALYEAKEYARAAEVAREMLDVLPEDVEMRYIRAAALTGRGLYDEARAEIARIRAVRPDHAGAARQEIYIDRAEDKIRTQIEHLRALIAMLTERIAAEEENRAYCMVFLASAYSLLGEALTLTGESAEAVEAFLASSRLEERSWPMCRRSRLPRMPHAGTIASASAISRPICAHIPSGH